MRLGLKLVAANGSQAVAVPAGRTLVVGRSPACDVPIRDLTVSRHHGEIEAAAVGLRVRDLGSTNGTFINGARISEGVAAPGSRVAFGKVAFQVLEERVPGDEPGQPDAEDDAAASLVTVVGQTRAQGSTQIATLLASERDTAAGDFGVRVRGESPAERRAASLAILLEIAKELSQQGEAGRLLDKAARLALQILRVDRVDILLRGEGDEMVPRASKVRAGARAGSVRLPRVPARKAVIERVAVLIAGPAAAAGTEVVRPAASGAVPMAAAATSGIGGGSGPVEVGEVGEVGRPPVLATTTDSVQTVPRTSEAAASGEAPSGAMAPDSSGLAAGPPAGAAAAAGADTGGPAATAPAAAGGGPAAETGGAGEAAAASESARGSAICAPLLGMQANVLGLIYVAAGEEGALGREELEFTTAFAGVVAVTLDNLRLMERARDEAVSQAGYQRHFAPFVAEQIAGQDGGIGLNATRRRVAFLSCEVRGLAALAGEDSSPGEVLRLLSELYGELVELVFEHGGTLDNLTGRGLTALWGAPLGRHDDADEAVQAAMGMQRGLERLNGEWSRHGRLNLAIAIGIDLGPALAGNVGTERRREFTAVGGPVERSAQLCTAAGAGEILASEALIEALTNPPPVDALPPGQVLAGSAAAANVAGAGGGAGGADPEAVRAAAAYRIDWRTPPTLRQSGELPRHL